jgi:hypothetical protein
MWIVFEGKYSFSDEFLVREVVKETPKRYYYRNTFEIFGVYGHGYVPKSSIVGVFPTEEMAQAAVGRVVLRYRDDLEEARQEAKNLRAKLAGMEVVIADLKKRRGEALRQEASQG